MMNGAHRRSGFSLIELMIAIIILGLGMVMVAMIFPVAWDRARDMSEETKRSTIVDTARMVTELSTQVDGLSTEAGSFVGDLVYVYSYEAPSPPVAKDACTITLNGSALAGDIIAYADTRVHHLHMENMKAVGPRSFVPDPASFVDGPGQYHNLDGLHSNSVWIDWPAALPDELAALGRIWFGRPQVQFEDRVFPALPKRISRDFTEDDERWDEVFDTRRFAWGVFHRLREQFGPEWSFGYYDGTGGDRCAPPAPPAGSTADPTYVYQDEIEAQRVINQPREFDMYYVSLRRPQQAYRYARQDAEVVPDPLTGLGMPVEVAALPAAEDVVLPEPWRVQILLPAVVHDPLIVVPTDPNYVPVGVPTEVRVGVIEDETEFSTNTLAATLFQKGTPFIDERSGDLYKVVKYRTEELESGGITAYMTLDKQIVISDVNDDPEPPLVRTPGELTSAERLRTVWMYPPPVTAERPDDGSRLYFAGDQPVIGIDVDTLKRSPRQ